ncbi:retrotransposon protein, putative, ty1-copia subclass, partial [Tanacetum coccineum]
MLALSLYMGNGQRAAVEAIGSYNLCFPSGLVIILHNCHYAPSITRGVISVSRLYDDGFINHFDGNTISVSRNNVVYFSVVPRDGIYEIDLSNSNTNNRSMYAVSNKRAKLNLDSTLLWHCRLGHISKKRIEKLQHDGLLNSTDIKSFEKCVSCMSGKMARKPYSHQVKRAKDLLQLAAKGNNQGKGKSKLSYAPKPKIPPPPKKTKSYLKELALQGLKGSRKLKPGALSLYMGNGQRAAVEAIGSYDFCFPSGLVIVLHNCHYAPSITRGVISVSRFVIPWDGIYEIDLSNFNTNNHSMYAISNKRAKINLNSSLLWHCYLGHISKKRIEKLQQDGLLNSIDTKSFDKCVSCLSGKMARKPYSHQVKRAKDLLGLIHTDVCGPFRIVSRQGAKYFVTFTDDFSCYGYVYLLKHKHEVFETFK